MRTIGMVWRKSSPLAKQLTEIAEAVRRAADGLRASRDARGLRIGDAALRREIREIAGILERASDALAERRKARSDG